jgi:hypothetical protein
LQLTFEEIFPPGASEKAIKMLNDGLKKYAIDPTADHSLTYDNQMNHKDGSVF